MTKLRGRRSKGEGKRIWARGRTRGVDLNVHMNLFQGDSDQRFVTRIWLDYEKQNECE